MYLKKHHIIDDDFSDVLWSFDFVLENTRHIYRPDNVVSCNQSDMFFICRLIEQFLHSMTVVNANLWQVARSRAQVFPLTWTGMCMSRSVAKKDCFKSVLNIYKSNIRPLLRILLSHKVWESCYIFRDTS